MSDKKVIVILGPTASGKTAVGVKLAKALQGEIISADSRQVYRGMDVGTGKDLKEYEIEIKGQKSKTPVILERPQGAIESHRNGDAIASLQHDKIKIPYHLIDVADPKEVFDLAQYQKLAFKAIDDILKRKKLPIVVGGSGLYLQAIVDNYQLSTAKPDAKLRAKLERKTLIELQKILAKQNKVFFAKLNNSDKNNKRRLIRYIEVTQRATRNAQRGEEKTTRPNYNFLLIGLKWPKEVLAQRIAKRLKERLEKEAMVEEVQGLYDEGVSYKRLESFGLEYKFIAQYLQEKLDYDEMFIKLNTAIRQFAKRQLTWFRRWEKQGAKINWENKYQNILSKTKKFLK